jgi:RNA polymerase I-specific transcription initiation factor RRN7
MLLRIPITVADLTDWVNAGELCYYRASKEIPLSMRDRLPGHLQEQLEPQDLVAPETLQRKMLEWLTTLTDTFGMAVPPINHPPVLYRWVQELSLPLEVYVGAQRLGRVLNVDHCYRLNAKAGTLMSLRYPEIRLMALVVITTKLLFPFDNGRRYPATSNELAALRMDWKVWDEQQQKDPAGPDHDLSNGETSERNHLPFRDAFSMTEAGSLDLAGDSLDQYLDWCENHIASEEVRERGRAGREADFRRALFRMFPSGDPQRNNGTRAAVEMRDPGKSSADRLRQVQGALRPERVVVDEGSDDVPRAGSSYAQYRGRAQRHVQGLL